MLLNIKELVKGKSFRLCMKDVSIEKIATALCTCTRETDIKGWYKQGRVIGILFTELDREQKESLIDKIKESLEKAINSRQMEKITITCFCFPEKNGETRDIEPHINKALYKHASMGNLTRKVLRVTKRITDIVGSTFGIILFSPFFIVIPILIKLSSKGPVFFKQERVGRYGQMFTFLKFRSMYVNNNHGEHKDFMKKFITGQQSDKDGDEQVYKMKNDPRVTKIGKFLRKSSLDELPQFINVLAGKMSLVGPRPAIPYEVEEYDTWHKRRVIETKPGITGVWQVDGRSNTPFEKMVRMDINYIKNWSLLLDIKLILKTPLAVFAANGAY
jgi:exopolysaccharide biosynthesis polyprenyl glycosylphosphotransferase